MKKNLSGACAWSRHGYIAPTPAGDAWNGQVAEWLKAHAWNACIRATVSRVRIPLCPPFPDQFPETVALFSARLRETSAARFRRMPGVQFSSATPPARKHKRPPASTNACRGHGSSGFPALRFLPAQGRQLMRGHAFSAPSVRAFFRRSAGAAGMTRAPGLQAAVDSHRWRPRMRRVLPLLRVSVRAMRGGDPGSPQHRMQARVNNGTGSLPCSRTDPAPHR